MLAAYPLFRAVRAEISKRVRTRSGRIRFHSVLLIKSHRLRLSQQHLRLTPIPTRRDSGIRSDPNRPDDEQYIVRLIGQVIRVSVDTVRLVASLPEKYSEKPCQTYHATIPMF